ncbi:hypothetical protein N7468_001615 [Penicillium chermesinum]|uniref:ERCC4 domain-containing protein n=1 Tax=Penicillium chermesinum TaxID=63820 RepID=A0A9W9PI87_9EURO|nr:uncharacterized protein N7468_001615 [Penicillium chermesinum]KAJ5246632.1 hypothetical protein N7468_001615 [Penicillium chermesinum]KAJ6144904.1 hypothetical protein N7470_008799 [Penicillium chermesinum]
MPVVIDLLSSDPPGQENLRERTKTLDAATSSRPLHPQLHIDPISSDSIDSSLFDFDSINKPAKKRRISSDKRSPLRRISSALENSFPDPSFNWSDDDFLLPPSNPAAARKQRAQSVQDSDPIFTSPAPQSHSKPVKSISRITIPEFSDITTVDDDDHSCAGPTANISAAKFTQESIEEFSDPFSVPGFADIVSAGQTGNSGASFSSKTAALLSSLEAKHRPAGPGNRKAVLDSMGLPNFSDGVEEPMAPKRPARKPTKMSTEEKEAKAKTRAETKAQKDRDRQLEKEKKLQAKEQKAKEKQLAADIAEVNKLKVDKKESTPEMIIDIASSLEGSSLGNQAVEFMKRLGVQHTFFESPIPHVIKWRRKLNATYNEALGYWEPCPSYIAHEKHILCWLPAQDFVDMVLASAEAEQETLDLHVLKVRSAYPEHKLIYLIEGLTAWMRKNSNSRNRAYQAQVLAQYEPAATEAPTTGRGRGRKKKNKPETTPPVDDDTIEDALLSLQVAHSCLIHHSNVPAESAEWIKNFTEHISTIPYRRERIEGNDSAFCMDTGQVKTGDDKLDTFVKMLGEVNRITASMAYGITNQYTSVTDLVRGMRIHGPTMLEDVRVSLKFSILVVSSWSFPFSSMCHRLIVIQKSANKNGALTEARIGPAASKRLYKVFTGLDPSSTDI